MIRAVLDTNVLVSALLSPGGKAALIVQVIEAGLIEIVLTDAIEQEYVAVLARPKFDFPPASISALLDMLRQHGKVVRPDPSAAASPDADDTKFLQCALAGRADALVTGNKRDFPDGPYGPTTILSITEFLQRLSTTL